MPQTKRKTQTEEKAADTLSRQLLALLQHMRHPLLMIEGARLIWWNPEAAKLLHLPMPPRPLPVETAIHHPGLREMLRYESPHGEGELHFPDGRIFSATLTALPSQGILLLLQEITAFKEKAQSRSEFVATVAHDLRTPLTAAQGYIELLERVGPLNETQRDFIQRALLSLRHIADLIEDLLDAEQLSEQDSPVMHRLDLRALIQKLCTTYHPIAEEAGLRLCCELPSEPLWVMGNASRLRQAIENLLSNAIKYNRPGGWIVLRTRRSDEHVIVSVSDNGVGIPPEEQGRIFQRFYRVRGEQHEQVPGHGLGLSIVKTVIEQHNGRIWVKSTPGEGSTFSFILPLLPPETES